jgi:hypothetical protein
MSKSFPREREIERSCASSTYLAANPPEDRDEASSWMGLLYALAVLVLVAAVAGLSACAPTLTAQSAAPPGRAARLDPVTGFWGDVKHYRLELSQGVALAMSCEREGPCQRMSMESADPSIAEVKRASLGTLQPTGAIPNPSHGMATASALVVVGKKPGTTLVKVRAKGGEREIRVTIVPPPPQSPPATVAK